MPLRPTLLAEVQAALGSTISPSLSVASAASDIFEAYVFSLILQAARIEGADVRFRDVTGSVPTTFVFRTSPGYIFSTRHPYTHAVITFPGKPILESHLGVRVSGRSEVLHECDVAVLFQAEAETCRRNRVSPRSSKLLFGVECKFYTTDIKLDLARAFIGLQTDLSSRDCFFVINTTSDSVEKLLARRRKSCGTSIVPSSMVAVERLRSAFQTSFANFKAMY